MANRAPEEARQVVPVNAGTEAGVEGNMPEIVGVLGGCRLFRDLTEEQLRMVAAKFRVRDHRDGEVIFAQGDLGSKIYLIERGQVRLERSANLGGRETKKTLSLLGECRMLGCWACLLGDCRHLAESAVCHKPTRVVEAEGSDLRAMMEGNPQIALVLLKRLCFMLDEKLHDCHCAMGTL